MKAGNGPAECKFIRLSKIKKKKKFMVAKFILGPTRFKKDAFAGFVTFDVVHMNTPILYLGQP